MRRFCLLAAWLMIGLGSAESFGEVGATPVDRIKHLPGFTVELLYSVPTDQQGSWVSLCVDNKGRLITSDQYGKLFRITPPPVGLPAAQAAEQTKIEPINVAVGMAQGLLYAFDALYVSVNSNRAEKAGLPGVGSGLYRVTDTDGDDQFDKVELLRAFEGSSEHGPHSLVLSPDGQSIYLCAGNHTKIPAPETSVVPRAWNEDFLISRLWDAGGHAKGIMAPGGWIVRTDKDGKSFDLVSIGFRNEYDIAFNASGELFTFDADMEWDIGSPWYRPTRVNHVTSGSEFGWRSGTGKWPEYYPDSLGSVVDIGPGSPTGIVFGTGAKFPAKYQQALFLADWSYGTVYAVHMTPDGSSYTGEAEKFLTAQPLPVTDMVTHPDGAMYFTIGGRETQSGLYRVTYTGEESTAAVVTQPDAGTKARSERQQLESLHHPVDAAEITTIWPQLSNEDRVTRFAARVALEHQPVDSWRALALAEAQPTAAIQAIIALAHQGQETDHAPAIETLSRLDWSKLTDSQRLDLVRTYALVFIRLGRGSDASRAAVTQRFDALFPNSNRFLSRELALLLVYLDAPDIAARTVKVLQSAPTQEDQIHYVLTLKDHKATWTPEARAAYYTWFNQAAAHRGGNSFSGFLANIRTESLATLTPEETESLKSILETKIVPIDPTAEFAARPIVKKWTIDELLPVFEQELQGRNFENGRKMFAAGACFKCHRVRGEGGSVGPDLTGVGGRFNHKNLLESLIDPNKVISDQYEMTQFVLTDGKQLSGRVVNLAGKQIMVMTNMLDPGNITKIARGDVELMQRSTVSMMPEGLLDRLSQDEILDLAAFLKSGGNPDHEAFAAALQQTPSGLKYRIVRPGAGKKPTAKDTVVCHYRGKLTNGTEFDSSYKRNEPTSFPLNAVIAGWTEGLQLIGEGGKIELEIPPALGYGASGIPPIIPANAVLMFEVELIQVK